jgi:spore protease
MKLYITDLAAELLRRTPRRDNGISVAEKRTGGVKVTTMKITSAAGAKKIGKPVGTYINCENQIETDNSAVISRELRKIIPKSSRILAVGLGNDRFIADSLGPKVLSYINTGKDLMTFEPNVKGITGINSVDAIKQIVKLCKPDFVVVIDSLVSGAADKIGTNYQIATTGITPGSGIGRDNKRLDKRFLGVPVIAIGVPICTIITTKKNTLHATVKEIDQIIAHCALNIANGINGCIGYC